MENFLLKIVLGIVFTLFFGTFSQTMTPSFENKSNFVVWLHKYDWDSAVNSVKIHSNGIGEVSPVWYEVEKDSSINRIQNVPVDSSELISIVKEHNIILRPLISNVYSNGAHPEYIRPMFVDKDLRSKHINEIIELVIKHNYDGVDIDYEGFKSDELPLLASLIKDIAEALHSKGKTLAVSIDAQTDDRALPSWKTIGAYADSVRLMNYGQSKLLPGPLVQLSWVENNLVRALKVIPKEKLVQGIAVYGLSWQDKNRSSGTWEKYSAIASKNHVEENRDKETKTLWYSYKGETVWYEDFESIQEKMLIGKKLGVVNFAFWRLGGEDPRIFTINPKLLK